MNVTPNIIGFERQYDDRSGVEYAVRLSDDVIEIESVEKVFFPETEIAWLRACLEQIASAIEARSDATGTGAAEGESAVPQGDAQ
jgi:hypothetical protein